MAFLAAALPAIGAIATVAGTGIQIAGQLQGGAYQAQVARNNASIAREDASYERVVGMDQAGISSMKGAAKSGAIKATQAANGVDVNSGSAVAVQAGEREADTLDAETILNNSELSAYGYTTQAKNFEAEAQQDQTSSVFNALGTLASGAGQLASKWGTPGGAGTPKVDTPAATPRWGWGSVG